MAGPDRARGDDELAIVRKVRPVWKKLRDGVNTTPREADVVAGVDWSRFDLPVADRPVLVIRGGRDCSPVYPRPEDIPRFVTDAEVASIPGQGHLAMSFAPTSFAEVVLDFLDRHS